MNKELKQKLIKHNEEMRAAFPNLYDNRWVEKAADEGWKDLIKNFEKIEPKLAEYAKHQEGYNVFAVIYYSSFESTLNTFFVQCLDDSITNCKLILDKLQNVTAEIKTKL